MTGSQARDRPIVEMCPACYGEGCLDCDDTGSITHGPWFPCRFCNQAVCNCKVCQDYCTCHGFQDHYIKPYQEENDRT